MDRGGGEVKRRRCDVRKLNTKDMDQAEAAKKYVRVSENCVNWVSRISNLPDREKKKLRENFQLMLVEWLR